MSVADRCSVLRRGKYIGTVNIADTNQDELSRMMVGRDVQLVATKEDKEPGEVILHVENMTVPSKLHHNNAVKNVSFDVLFHYWECLLSMAFLFFFGIFFFCKE